MPRAAGNRPGTLVTTALVIAESGYLLNRVLGPPAEQALLAMILDDTLDIEALTKADWARASELIGTYHDLILGVTDATLIAIAERLGSLGSRRSTIETSGSSDQLTPTPSNSSPTSA